MARRPYRNPFYALLVVAGILFVITVFAYGFMAFQSLHGSPADIDRHHDHPLWAWMRANGNTAVLTELAVLGVLCLAAMGTEGIWEGRGARKGERKTKS
jgi:hypothetical protein